MKRLTHRTLILALALGAAPLGCGPAAIQPINSSAIQKRLGKPDDEPTDISPPTTQPTTHAQASPQDLAPLPAGPENPPAPTLTPPAPGPVKDAKFPAEKIATLPNGLTVIVAENHDLPTADVLLVMPGGSSAEPAELPGAAEFVAGMLKEGTQTQTKDQIAETIEFVGGDLSSWADRDTADLSTHVLSKDLPLAMKLLADVTENPKFDDAAIEKVRAESLSDLADSESSPQFLAAREFARVVYSDGPYSHYGATKASLTKIAKKDLSALHDSIYLPNAATLVIVGDVSSADAIKLATSTFGSWKKGTLHKVDLPTPKPLAGGTVYLVDRPGSVQAYFMFGEPALKRSSADFPSIEVATTVLGGNAAARLFVDLREKQSLTYGAYSRLGESVGVGAFSASGQVRNAVVEDAWKGFADHLTAISAAAPTADETKAAETYLGGTFTISLEQPQTIASLIVDARLWGLPANYWDTYRSKIEAVTPDQALASAKKYIHESHEAAVIVGDAKALQPILQKYANLEIYDSDGTLQGKVARTTDSGAAGNSAAANH